MGAECKIFNSKILKGLCHCAMWGKYGQKEVITVNLKPVLHHDEWNDIFSDISGSYHRQLSPEKKISAIEPNGHIITDPT